MNSTRSGTEQEAQAPAMKIYFCDICNESIPLKDINSNRITIEEGKIFCQKCAPKKQKSGERIPAPLWASMLLLLGGLGLVSFLGWRSLADLDQGQRELKTLHENSAQRLASLDAKIVSAVQDLETFQLRVPRLGDDLMSLKSEMQQRLGELDRRESQNHDAQAKIVRTGLEGLTTRFENAAQELQKAVQALQIEAAGQKVSLEALKDQIVLVREMVTVREPATPVPAPLTGDSPKAPSSGDGVSPAVSESPESREVNTLIAQLQDPDSNVRYSAVVELSRFSGPKVVKALESMLTDSEDYIRSGVIKNLLKLGSMTSIPLMIASLRDKDYYVRVDAQRALRSLSGTEIAFDADGSPSERETKVKEWERWWDGNKDRILRGG